VTLLNVPFLCRVLTELPDRGSVNMHRELMSPSRLEGLPHSLTTLPTEVVMMGSCETSMSREDMVLAGEMGVEKMLSLGGRLTKDSAVVVEWEDPMQQEWKDCVECVCVCVCGGGGSLIHVTCATN